MKRLANVVVAVALALVVGACGSTKVDLPPVEPEQVEVFMPGEYPTVEYKVLANLQEKSREALVAKAAQLGADALIVTEDHTSLGIGEQGRSIEGLAVYFPSRHPELEKN